MPDLRLPVLALALLALVPGGPARASSTRSTPDRALAYLVPKGALREAAREARRTLDPADKAALQRRIDGGDPAEVLAVLALELERGLRLRVPRLVALMRGRHPDLRRAAARLLARRRRPDATRALVRQLRTRGRAASEAARALGWLGDAAGHKALQDCAAQADPGDRIGLACVRALGRVPGDYVTRLLMVGASDRDRRLRKACKRALAHRQAAGLPTRIASRAIPYGASIEDLARGLVPTARGGGSSGPGFTLEDAAEIEDPNQAIERLLAEGYSEEEIEQLYFGGDD